MYAVFGGLVPQGAVLVLADSSQSVAEALLTEDGAMVQVTSIVHPHRVVPFRGEWAICVLGPLWLWMGHAS